MQRSLAIKFNENYTVHFHCEKIDGGQNHLKIVTVHTVNDKTVDTTKQFFLEDAQLTMICDYFTGVKNDLNN